MVGLHTLGMLNALGNRPQEIYTALVSGKENPLSTKVLTHTGESVPVAAVDTELEPLTGALSVYDCRNHRLGVAAYRQIEASVETAKARYGAHRIGVVLGSSTAGLDATEAAYEMWSKTGSLPDRYDYRRQHAMGSVSEVIAVAAGLDGPRYTLSTACTSSVKAMVSARGLIEQGFCDAVITGGVDTLCQLTLAGFDALGTVSRKRANPMSAGRDGLNIGEGAALFLMTKEPGKVNLIGAGESCDAHHMSAPHPEGEGAEAAMRAALADADLDPRSITYLNLHGTATPHNDAMEAKAVHRLFGEVYCSSTKPMTGHTLGAAGAVEAGFCWSVIQFAENGALHLPPHHWDGIVDETVPSCRLVAPGTVLPVRGKVYMMSNSFAFGGNNCSIVLAGEVGS